MAGRDRALHGVRRRPGRRHHRSHRRVPVDLADARGVRQQPHRRVGLGRAGDGDRRSARLSHGALRVPRRRAGADAGRAAARDAAVRRRRRDAAVVRTQRLVQPAAQRRVRLSHSIHGRPRRRHLRRGPALLSVHPAEPLRRARQHRRRDGGSRAEPRQPRLPPLPPRRVPARGAGLRRRCRAGVRQGVRRPWNAARAERHQHARAAGVPAHHVGRPRGPDRVRDRARHDRVLDRRARAVGVDHEGARLRDADARRFGAAPSGRSAAGAPCSRTAGCCSCWPSCCRRTWDSCCCRSRRSGAFPCCPTATRSRTSRWCSPIPAG